MEDLRVAAGGAGPQTFLFISHQPLVGVGGHVAGHVLFGPGVQPGLKASVQARVDPLVGLKENRHSSGPGTTRLLKVSSFSQGAKHQDRRLSSM